MEELHEESKTRVTEELPKEFERERAREESREKSREKSRENDIGSSELGLFTFRSLL